MADDKSDERDRRDPDAGQLFDPYEKFFRSQNKRNDFVKALEDGQHESAYFAIH